ncbi:MAG: hypothetical protein E5X72_06140 [Mesorhizobium sp.]|uniref:hypothetical protein n=1 Tax=Mesorhizobium sp. TaxID=1871066 RepID=UPI0012168F79|nr:hypothetical protein [Mesorhizobium sp.]TIP05708.1 MAG: hypothetical protein E5X72_06140 [Mesorhizobium sp.]
MGIQRISIVPLLTRELAVALIWTAMLLASTVPVLVTDAAPAMVGTVASILPVPKPLLATMPS